MNQPPGPYPPPHRTPAEMLAAVPVYRRNSTASAPLLLALALGFGGPLVLGTMLAAGGAAVALVGGLLLGAPLLAVCFIVLTGDVYYDAFDEHGQLKKWGVDNKVVAALIIAGWLASIAARFV